MEVVSTPLKVSLLNDLNGIINGESIFESNRFSNITLVPEVICLLDQNLQGAALAKRNRLLLQSAFPGTRMVNDYFLVSLAFLCFGALRLFDLLLYKTREIFLDPLTPETAAYLNFRRSILLLFINYGEVLLWFAAAYKFFSPYFTGSCVESLRHCSGSLYFSAVTMATVGYGDITPQTDCARWLVVTQILVSIYLVLFVFTHFLSFLPRPPSHDPRDESGPQ